MTVKFFIKELMIEISKIPKYKRDKVKIYICDMSPTYIEIGKMLFKNASVLDEKFEFVKKPARKRVK